MRGLCKSLITVASLLSLASMHGAQTLYFANLTPDEVAPKNGAESPTGISTASGYATFEYFLNLGDPYLIYEIHVEGINFLVDVTAVHFHRGHSQFQEVAATAESDNRLSVQHAGPGEVNGPHLLNVYGLPREDDADLFVDPGGSFIRGKWDNSDLNFGEDGIYDAGDSVNFGAAIEDLLSGDIYVQIHTLEFNVPNTGELRGQILSVPEPHAIGFGAAALAGVLLVRRLRRA